MTTTMQNYRLSDNGFFLPGYSKVAYYDVNNNKIYTLENELFDSVAKGSGRSGDIPKSAMKFLLEKSMLVPKKDINKSKSLIDESSRNLGLFKRRIESHREKRRISTVQIELTNNCNYTCSHCYLGEDLDKNTYLGFDQFERIIESFEKLGLSHVDLTGGEPLLYGGLPDILRYLYSKGLIITLKSNGSLMNTEILSLLKKYDVDLQVSIYRLDAKSHSGNILDRVIHLCRSVNYGNVRYVYVVNKTNLPNLGNFISTCFRRKVMCSIGEIYPLGNAFCNWQFIKLTEKGKTYVLEQKRRISQEYDVENEFKFSISPCNSNSLVVLSSGDVLPCPFARQKCFSFGNMKEESIDDILSSANCLSWRSATVDEINICSECEYRYYCMGRCIAVGINHRYRGKIYPNPFCDQYPQRIRRFYRRHNYELYEKFYGTREKKDRSKKKGKDKPRQKLNTGSRKIGL